MLSSILCERIARAARHRNRTQDAFLNTAIQKRLKKSPLSTEYQKSKTRAIAITLKRIDLEFGLRRLILPNVNSITSKPSSYVYQMKLSTLANCLKSFKAENLIQQCSLESSVTFVCPKGRVVAASNSTACPFYAHSPKLFPNQTQCFDLLDAPIGSGILILDESRDGVWILGMTPGREQHEILGHPMMAKIGWIKKEHVALHQSLDVRLSCGTSELKLSLPKHYIDNRGYFRGPIVPPQSYLHDAPPPCHPYMIPSPPHRSEAPPPPPPIHRPLLKNNSAAEFAYSPLRVRNVFLQRKEGFLNLNKKRRIADLLGQLGR